MQIPNANKRTTQITQTMHNSTDFPQHTFNEKEKFSIFPICQTVCQRQIEMIMPKLYDTVTNLIWQNYVCKHFLISPVQRGSARLNVMFFFGIFSSWSDFQNDNDDADTIISCDAASFFRYLQF